MQAPWPLALVIAALVLVLLDIVFRALWHPQPVRFPEQFSAAYLDDYIDAHAAGAPVVVLGDSVLWGYHVAEGETPVAALARLRPHTPLLNLSYEGGSVVNSLFALRRALARGVHPAAVIVNLNSKEFNSADSAYKRLLPALERTVAPTFSERDRQLLTTLPAPSLADRLDAIVAGFWALYRHRVDIRVALFGHDDFAGLVTAEIRRFTGEEARYERAHRPTPDAFLGTYNLDPIAPDNVEAVYLGELRAELIRDRIPAVAFLTPTNHRLLGATIDDPAYVENLARITALIRGPRIRVVDLDRLDMGAHFIDNDHLDAAGGRILAERLAPELDAALK